MKLTKEQENISRKNKRKVREYFGIYGNTDYVLHHIDPSLQYNDPERYIQWNIEDLVVMSNGEHTAYHNSIRLKGDNTDKYEKVSKSLKGHEVSEECRQKLREHQTGKKWYHKDSKDVFIRPEEWEYYESLGYVQGRSNYPEKRTEANKKKIAEAQRGKKMYTNGEKNMWANEGDIIPDGFWLGKTIKKNKVI